MNDKDKSSEPFSSSASKVLPAKNESPLMQFTHKIGKSVIIEKDSKLKSIDSKNITSPSQGFHCSTCNATFTSSDAFLDHCNSRVHQKNLGSNLKVERVDEVDRIKSRLQMLSQNRLIEEQVIESKSTEHFEKKLDYAQLEADKLKQDRKIRKKSKKEFDDEADDYDDSSKELLDAMGFISFS
jgi:U4/U6.U5 tri-snRNP component SNU23